MHAHHPRLVTALSCLLLACAPYGGASAAPGPSKGPADPTGTQPKAEASKPGERPAKGDASESPDAIERVVTTRHKLGKGLKALRYTAAAGTMTLRDAEGEATASVFYIAYTRDGVKDPKDRPITFAFNGGPGSSAVWLQLGTLGPRRVDFPDAVAPAPPPYSLIDNEYTLLERSDLVFIDPVGTGFSRALAGASDKNQFYGVKPDVEAVAEVIRTYCSRAGRWNSPKYLAGESYGTTRAAALVNHLQGQGMFFNGVILVSSILNFQTARFSAGNDLPYILFLPSYAATAWYHDGQQGGAEGLRAYLEEVREFARTDYALALLAGARLDASTRQGVTRSLARYTGLEPGFIEQSDLRVPPQRFFSELLRARTVTVGRLDSRYVGSEAVGVRPTPSYDPSYAAILGPYTAAMNHYVREELQFAEDRKYEILSGEVGKHWRWSDPTQTGYVNVAEDLARAMRTNPHLRVFIANGYYDLATPFFATEYTVDHLRVSPSARKRVTMGYYESGHMMYIHKPSLAALASDLSRFVTGS